MKLILCLLILVLIVGGAAWGKPVVAGTRASSHADAVESQNAAPTDGEGFWQQWSAPKNVSQCPTDEATYPALSVSEDAETVYLAWTDDRAAVRDIYYASSTDGGWHWAEAQPVVATAMDSWRPSLVVSDNTPIFAWAESTSVTTHETKQMAWGVLAPVTLPNAQVALAYAPRLALGPGGELHMALQGGEVLPGGSYEMPDILYSRREAGALGWSSASIVFEHLASGSHNPAIAVSSDGQTVHLVWQENFTANQSEIYYVQGRWGAEYITWQSPTSLSTGISRSVRPSIVLEERTGQDPALHVVWGEQVGGYVQQYVRYIRSNDGGVSWGTPRRVSSDAVSANNVAPTDVAPSLARTPAGALCVAWHGFIPGVLIEAEEIYLTCSTDQGGTWGTPINVSNTSSVISIRPVLAAGSDGALHVAWQELAGGDPVTEYEIYYARSFPYRALLPYIAR